MYKLINCELYKKVVSPSYNFWFDKSNGFFMRYGKTIEENPQYSPFGPEILDLEISSGGTCLGCCPFCYKNNGGDSDVYNMSFDDFKTIFDKMPPVLTQIAFGIMNISTNPDFFKMMEYSREKGIVPNYTCHALDVNDKYARETASLCGAVAVSIVDKEMSYDAVAEFCRNGIQQVNIHFMLSEETYEKAIQTIDDISSDPRLNKLNAIVFLQYKPKGRNTNLFHSISTYEKYKNLIDYCSKKKINYGFDSCSAPLFFHSIQGTPLENNLSLYAEPCESGIFSSYINCHGEFYVCSFAEGENGWEHGIDVLHCDDFLKDVWYNDRVVSWRDRLLKNDRKCPIFHLSD